jgi:two-component system response regulator FixJ
VLSSIEEPPVGLRADGRPVVVLVASDWAVVNALTFMLETDGCYVLAFSSGEAVLSHDTSSAACFVIDEGDLGTMTGVELIDALRADKIETPVLLMAMHPDERLSQRAVADGVVIVEKPLLGPELSNAVSGALQGRSA